MGVAAFLDAGTGARSVLVVVFDRKELASAALMEKLTRAKGLRDAGRWGNRDARVAGSSPTDAVYQGRVLAGLKDGAFRPAVAAAYN